MSMALAAQVLRKGSTFRIPSATQAIVARGPTSAFQPASCWAIASRGFAAKVEAASASGMTHGSGTGAFKGETFGDRFTMAAVLFCWVPVFFGVAAFGRLSEGNKTQSNKVQN
jgi:hypothetical protein|mmetsp:Transcript_45942/g.131615  ORF Transcript_45942/g.131615 Transcript_45942/m.131615 type:complete len:113 (-) Transcript_45942:381-719(-)